MSRTIINSMLRFIFFGALVAIVLAARFVSGLDLNPPSSVNVRELKIKFLELISQQQVDLKKAKYVLSEVPVDPKAFHDYDDINDPMNPVISNVSVVVLHYLLNKFMLATTMEEKAQFLDIMQMGIERGMNVAASYKDDPPLYVKSVFVKEMNLTVSMITAAKKYMTQEVIARSRKMSNFLIMIYSMLAEVVPTAKLLLHVEKISETAGSRLSVPSTAPLTSFQDRKEIARVMLHSARLDKPAIKASELLQFSPTYTKLVDQISTPGPFSKSISLLNVIKSLDEYANTAIMALINAMKEDNRSEIALEHFFDLHVIPDDSQRNAFHYLCMARASTVLNSLTEAFKSDWDKNSSIMRSMMAERLLTSFEFADNRGHTPLTYCSMRYGHRRHDDIGSSIAKFFDVLKEDMTDSAFIDHVDRLKEVLFADEDTDSDMVIMPSMEAGTVFSVANSGQVESEEAANVAEIDGGGWSSERLEVNPEKFSHFAGPNHCDIKQVYLNSSIPNQEEFFMEYINNGIPVVFRGAALDSSITRMAALRHTFRKDNFLKVYGSKKVSASSLPYGGISTIISFIFKCN